MNEKRVQELISSMKSCSRETYYKGEVLDELLALQREMVSLTFNGEHASTADLKIYDVERHLKQLNKEAGHIANEQLTRFVEGSVKFCNLIKTEISGKAGEYKAFKALENVHTKNIILTNVELKTGNERTELDAVVITPFAITIVEVKNIAKDVFIDENGDLYRTGEYLRFDCGLDAKMENKEKILRSVLMKAGYQGRAIFKVVVFTNNRIEVRNKCRKLTTCFINQLPYIVDENSTGEYLYCSSDMDGIKKAIEAEICKERYPIEFDFDKYKRDFAELMAIVEEEKMTLIAKYESAELTEPAPENMNIGENKVEVGMITEDRKQKLMTFLKCAGAVATLSVVSVLSGIVGAKLGRKHS